MGDMALTYSMILVMTMAIVVLTFYYVDESLSFKLNVDVNKHYKKVHEPTKSKDEINPSNSTNSSDNL